MLNKIVGQRNTQTIRDMRTSDKSAGFPKKKVIKYKGDSDSEDLLGNSIFLISDEDKSDKGAAMQQESSSSYEDTESEDKDDDDEDEEEKKEEEEVKPEVVAAPVEAAESPDKDKAGFEEGSDEYGEERDKSDFEKSPGKGHQV